MNSALRYRLLITASPFPSLLTNINSWPKPKLLAEDQLLADSSLLLLRSKPGLRWPGEWGREKQASCPELPACPRQLSAFSGPGSPQQKGCVRCFLGSLPSACLLQAPLARPSWHLDSAPVPATDSVTSHRPPSARGSLHGPSPQRKGGLLFLSL